MKVFLFFAILIGQIIVIAAVAGVILILPYYVTLWTASIFGLKGVPNGWEYWSECWVMGWVYIIAFSIVLGLICYIILAVVSFFSTLIKSSLEEAGRFERKSHKEKP